MRQPWNVQRLIAVALGGVAGAALRWVAIGVVETGRFPWPVLAVNVAGSLLLGALLAVEWNHRPQRLLLHDAGAIGFCGGLTTFSTFSVEVVDLLRNAHTALAVLYATTSVSAAIAAVFVGAGVLRRVRAVTLPAEEAP